MGSDSCAFVSVIIPTHNRAATVAQAVVSALALDYPPDSLEIIVVDNDSTDATPDIVSALAEEARCPVRYVREARLGLHFARNAAIRAARGELLLFTDDDATFDPGCASAYARAFAQHPDLDAAGGPVRPVWETQPPAWLLDYIGDARTFGILSLMELGEEFRKGPKLGFYGVNMVVRHSVADEFGGFNPDSIGDMWVGDGETGFHRGLTKAGRTIGYVPDAVVYHHVPAWRMTPAYFRRRQANQGACAAYGRYHEGVPALWMLLADMAKITVTNCDAWVSCPRAWNGTTPRELDVQCRTAQSLGEIRWIVRLTRDRDFRAMVLKGDWLHGDEGVMP